MSVGVRSKFQAGIQKLASSSKEPKILEFHPGTRAKAKLIQQKAIAMARSINAAFLKHKVPVSLDYSFFDDVLNIQSDSLLMQSNEHEVIMTEKMAETAVTLFVDFEKHVYKKSKPIINIIKPEQGGKTKDSQNMAILIASCMYLLYKIKVFPIFLLMNDCGGQDQFEREWPLQQAYWGKFKIRNKKESLLLGQLISDWQVPQGDDWRQTSDHVGLWILRRSTSKSDRRAWMRYIETIKEKKDSHLLLINDEADVGTKVSGVTDEMFKEVGLYDYLTCSKRAKSNITLVNVSATLDLSHAAVKEFSITRNIEPDKGYRLPVDATTLITERAVEWGVKDIEKLGMTTNTRSHSYCNIESFIKLWYSHPKKLDKKQMAKFKNDPKVLATWEWYKSEYVPKKLAELLIAGIESGSGFQYAALRYLNKNEIWREELLPALKSHLPAHYEVLAYIGGEDEGVNYKEKDMKSAIETKYRESPLGQQRNPMVIIYTASVRRNTQLYDHTIQFDFTSKPSNRTSMRQNTGRGAGYKKNSEFCCSPGMHKARNKPHILTPGYYSDSEGKIRAIEQSMVITLKEHHRKYPVIDAIFKAIDEQYWGAELLEQIRLKIKQKKPKYSLQAGERFWKQNPQANNLLGVRGIIDLKAKKWIEDNQALLFQEFGSAKYDSIDMLWNFEKKTPEEYYLMTGKHQLFSFRQGEDVSTNLAWKQDDKEGVLPQIHYEVANKKPRCVMIALRLAKVVPVAFDYSQETIHPKTNTIMYQLCSAYEKQKIDTFYKGRVNVLG